MKTCMQSKRDAATAGIFAALMALWFLVAPFASGQILIDNIEALQKIGSVPGYPMHGDYLLTQDIDATDTAIWNDEAGFEPIGDDITPFTGFFDGQGYVISGLVINRPDEEFVGLFGVVGGGGEIKEVTLEGGIVSGGDAVGALVGAISAGGTVRHCYAATTVLGRLGVGGLVGGNLGGMTDCAADSIVEGDSYVGGLVGGNDGTLSQCSAGGEVTGDVGVGGLLGANVGGLVSSCDAATEVRGNRSVGGLVGANTPGSTVTESYATGSVTGYLGIGGLLGGNQGSVTGCYASGAVAGDTYIGGFVGYNEDLVAGCYATGAVSGYWGVGGLVGRNDGPVSVCYAAGLVEGVGKVGGLIGYRPMGGAVSASFWDVKTSGQDDSDGGTGLATEDLMHQATFTAAGWDFVISWAILEDVTYPWLRALPPASALFTVTVHAEHGAVLREPDVSDYPAWSVVWLTATPDPGYAFAGWAGTGLPGESLVFHANPMPFTVHNDLLLEAVFLPIGPKTVDSVADLQRIGRDSQWPIHWSYVLQGDIDASETVGWNEGRGFIPIGSSGIPFTGKFDGQGHTISGLVVHRPEEKNVGLFGSVGSGAEIRNLGLAGGTVAGENNVGGLAGRNRGAISGCHTTLAVTGDEDVGGLVGRNDDQGMITDCHASGMVSGGRFAGGLVGINGGLVSQSHAEGAVSGTDYIGGLIGINGLESDEWGIILPGTVTNCHASGAVSGNIVVGGLVGKNQFESEISQCYAAGRVEGNRTLGGLAGTNEGWITDCHATGDVESTGDYVGGLVGHNWDSTLSGCYATGAVRGAKSVGGLVGLNFGGAVARCYATGAVSGYLELGGLIGQHRESTVLESFATGVVWGYKHLGGLVGHNDMSVVNDCYARGPVSGFEGIGGLVGRNTSGEVKYCYAVGVVSGYADVGGLVGEDAAGTVTSSFWDVETSGQASSVGGGTGLPTEEMMLQSTFETPGWDFNEIWGILENISYPFFLWMPEEQERYHSADQDANNIISLSELLRVIQFYNSGGLHCAEPPESTEDGYVPGEDPAQEGCAPHSSDYNPQDWTISLSELLRLIQFYNSGGYHDCPDADPPTEDGYCPGLPL